MALDVASHCFSVKANRYDWEHIKVLGSETAGCHLRMGSTYVWHYHFLWELELLLGPLIEEASTGWQRVLYQHSLGRAVQENIQFSTSVLALPTVGPVLPALNRLLLYCPPTCAIMIFIMWLTKPWTDNLRMLRSDWIHFVFLNQIFCCIRSAFRHIGSAFHVTRMGVADWVES